MRVGDDLYVRSYRGDMSGVDRTVSWAEVLAKRPRTEETVARYRAEYERELDDRLSARTRQRPRPRRFLVRSSRRMPSAGASRSSYRIGCGGLISTSRSPW